jgi:hypothetical protein
VSVSFATPSSDCTVSFADKSTTKCYETVAGQYIPAGKVCLEVVNGAKETVKITYDTRGTAACLQEVQAYFGDNIPGSNPGAYPEKAAMGSGCAQTYTVTTDLIPDCNNANLFVNRGYKLAAHSSVQYTDGNGGQTAWTRGKPIDGGSWAMYSDVFLSCQCGGVQQITVEKPLTALPTKQPSKVSIWKSRNMHVPRNHIVLNISHIFARFLYQDTNEKANDCSDQITNEISNQAADQNAY